MYETKTYFLFRPFILVCPRRTPDAWSEIMARVSTDTQVDLRKQGLWDLYVSKTQSLKKRYHVAFQRACGSHILNRLQSVGEDVGDFHAQFTRAHVSDMGTRTKQILLCRPSFPTY